MLFMINETRNWYVLDNHKIKFLDSDNPEEKVDPQKYRQEALDFIYEQHGNELYNVKYTFDGEEY